MGFLSQLSTSAVFDRVRHRTWRPVERPHHSCWMAGAYCIDEQHSIVSSNDFKGDSWATSFSSGRLSDDKSQEEEGGRGPDQRGRSFARDEGHAKPYCQAGSH